MKIGIPILHDRISPLLDTSVHLLVLTCKDGQEQNRWQSVIDAPSFEAKVRQLAELELDYLLCAAVSAPLLQALEERGLRVRSHLCGEVEAILKALCCGELEREEFRMPGCHEQHVSPVITPATGKRSTRA